jgi:predicted DNA-binding transcriptional regulator AlpA
MLSNPNSATSKSPDRDHGDIRFDRTQVGVSMSNGVSKFLRLKNLEELGIAKSHQAVRHMQMHYGFPLGRLLGPGTRVWTEDEINEWLASRPVEPSEQTRQRAQRSVEARSLPTARQMLDRGAA